MISVVLAVRDEPPPSALLLERLREGETAGSADGPAEILVAAALETPAATLEAWRAAGARVLVDGAPRGARLGAAAALARGDVLLFLHADTLLPPAWRAAVSKSFSPGVVGGAFRLAFEGADAGLRLVALVARLRTALTRVPYGDQAPFVRREVYLRIGGHAPWPLLEDVDLFVRLRKEGRIALLREEVLTSARRYRRLGVARAVLSNWGILLSWRLGARPGELAGRYRREILWKRTGRGDTP